MIAVYILIGVMLLAGVTLIVTNLKLGWRRFNPILLGINVGKKQDNFELGIGVFLTVGTLALLLFATLG